LLSAGQRLAAFCAIYGRMMKLPGDQDGPEQRVPAGPERSAGRGGDADVIDMGSRLPLWPGIAARRATVAVALAALAAGLLLGYAGGHLQASGKGGPGAAVSKTPTATPQTGSPPITVTGSRCAVQRGKTLQLGIEIVNQSGRVVTLRRVWPIVPLGGMRPATSAYGTRGSLPELGFRAPAEIDAGATRWLTITFDVVMGCPRPLPVQFKVSYVASGKAATASFDSFPDLSQVRYTGCRAERSR
jgi:hypothetical protein